MTTRWRENRTRLRLTRLNKWATLAFAGAGLGGTLIGLLLESGWFTFACGVVALCGGIFYLRQCRANRLAAPPAESFASVLAAAGTGPDRPTDAGDLVEEMLADERYALLLRPQIVCNLTANQRRRATNALEEQMTVVLAGEVLMGVAGNDVDEGTDNPSERGPVGTLVDVEQFYLDRHPVTNRQYLKFVAAGGYQQMAIWDPQIWPAVMDFVDRTGVPGPRSWQNGCYASGADDHPLVGVSWYEAAAYARWVGKRLPTGAEWEKAASSPVQLPDAAPIQRRYPWGESMQRSRANVWGSGPGRTAAVEEFAAGRSAGGVHQMIGNVWEWTTDDFREDGLILPAPMKTIRGGAFDTYFDCQATCQFQSGEVPVNRKHNIGIRCALSACDLRPVQAAGEADPSSTTTDALEVAIA